MSTACKTRMTSHRGSRRLHHHRPQININPPFLSDWLRFGLERGQTDVCLSSFYFDSPPNTGSSAGLLCSRTLLIQGLFAPTSYIVSLYPRLGQPSKIASIHVLLARTCRRKPLDRLKCWQLASHSQELIRSRVGVRTSLMYLDVTPLTSDFWLQRSPFW